MGLGLAGVLGRYPDDGLADWLDVLAVPQFVLSLLWLLLISKALDPSLKNTDNAELPRILLGIYIVKGN